MGWGRGGGGVYSHFNRYGDVPKFRVGFLTRVSRNYGIIISLRDIEHEANGRKTVKLTNKISILFTSLEDCSTKSQNIHICLGINISLGISLSSGSVS